MRYLLEMNILDALLTSFVAVRLVFDYSREQMKGEHSKYRKDRIVIIRILLIVVSILAVFGWIRVLY